MQDTIIPKVFISYSWTKSELVLQVANRLMSHGVEVVLDKWDLKAVSYTHLTLPTIYSV